ncbi:MAG: sigma-70 family RNA polymerase sigma factor, partial [Cyanobacteriota bacterium]|nr:sigma-70 family RNA polymerase sigma factor [Cyanobacteriota bacterium]
EFYTDQEFMSQEINQLLLKLTPQQREVLTLRFGLVDGNERTLLQVGQRMGISRERVRQVEKQAFSKLKQYRDKIGNYLAN